RNDALPRHTSEQAAAPPGSPARRSAACPLLPPVGGAAVITATRPAPLSLSALGLALLAFALARPAAAGPNPDSYWRVDDARAGLAGPVTIDGKEFDAVTVAGGFDAPAGANEGLWMVPLRTPLAASGFTPHALKLLGERLGGSGLVPVQGGAAPARVAEEEK